MARAMIQALVMTIMSTNKSKRNQMINTMSSSMTSTLKNKHSLSTNRLFRSNRVLSNREFHPINRMALLLASPPQRNRLQIMMFNINTERLLTCTKEISTILSLVLME
jgi:hypothetical protein